MRLVVVSLVVLFCAQPVMQAAKQSKEVPAAPVPGQILTGKKVFLGNDEGERSSRFTGGADRGYNQFYAAMKSWGRYEMASSPENADLLFELRLTPVRFSNRVPDYQTLRLAIYDPKTHALLWAFNELIQVEVSQGSRDKNFDTALNRLVTDLQRLAGKPA